MTIAEDLAHPIDAAKGEGHAARGEAHHEEHGHEGAGEHKGEHAGHEGPVGKAGGAASKKKRDMVLIILGVVGLILTFIVYERSKSSSTAATATTPATGTLAGGTSGTAEPQAQNIASALNSYEQAAQAAYTQLADQQTANQNANIAAQSGLASSLGAITTELAALEAGGANATGNGSPPAGGQASGPPSLSAALEAQLKANGEYITQVAADAKGGFLYLTNKGGVYNAGGSPNYGSYLGLTPAQQNQTGIFTGLTPLAGGGYTESNSQGSSYSFGAGPGQTNLTGAA